MLVTTSTTSSSTLTPVTKDVKKTMSYARMSSHLLTPLMEVNEDNAMPILSSYLNLQPTVCKQRMLCIFYNNKKYHY